MKQIVYTLGGKAYQREGDNLFDTRTGEHVGRFSGDEVYAPDGTYVGELTSTGRLGTRPGSRGRSGPASAMLAHRGATGNADATQAGIPAGFEDFTPSAD